ncbi:hypothetical protein [Alteromonas sp. a30]|uniref:hypothetical protein n=1 Tax=Alteromonas sp. a30 TaxID=2730917 RepID=UPI00227F1642|nr:hypothetical protein [Alteromonas sp. a30]MCY7296088.1 hypothetical protein [Alteromonas sp. a30]
MMTALEEIKFRADSCSTMANIRPAEHLPPSKKAFGYRICSGYSYGAYIYNTALGLDENAKTHLINRFRLDSLAVDVCQEDMLPSLENIYQTKALLLEDVSEVSKKIISIAKTNTNEFVSHLCTILSCLRLEEDHKPYMDWFRKWEAKKYTSVLPGSSDAIEHLVNRDENNLVLTLDNMLLAHHKEAGNRHSNIYNSHAAFLSLAPYLILELAEHLGMELRSRITQNKKTLKLGLSSPADFPETPKNHKMPIEIDYLTAKTNITSTATD